MINFDQLVLVPCLATFGENVPPTYRPQQGTPFAVDGIFDAQYRDLTIIAEGPGSDTATPVLGVRLAQFMSPPVKGDEVYIASVATWYVVNGVHPDGHGGAKLTLNKSRRQS